MFTNFPGYIFVVCITFSSMVQPSSIQNYLKHVEMDPDLQHCEFSPAKIYNLTTQGDFSLVCAVMFPVLTEGTQMLMDLEFYFFKYLCMELYDLSLQLCEPSTLKIIQKEEFPRVISSPKVTNFCKELNFSESRAVKTREWANVTINCLKNISFCEKNCISQNRLNPLCEAIYWASKVLMSIDDNKSVTPVSQVSSSDPKVMSPFSSHDPKVQTEVKDDNSTNSKDVVASKLGGTNISAEISRATSTSGKSDMKNITEATSLPKTNKNQPPRIEGSTYSILTQSRGGEKPPPLAASPSVGYTGSYVTVNTETEASRKELGNEHDDVNTDTARSRENVELSESGYLRNSPDIDSGNFSPKENMEEDTSHEENKPSGYTDDTFPPTGNSVIGPYRDTFVDVQDSHFFAYFLTMIVLCIVGYLVFHNKQKIIALALEGRRMQGSRRRPNTSSYKKLDSNLEEAVTSTCSSSSVTHVIF